jgi:hypothetical protein
MLLLVRRILADLRSGENIDTYVTIAVALGLAVLNLVSAVPADKLSGVLLAVLGLLAVGVLATRVKLETLVRETRSSTPTLLKQYPAAYEAALTGAGDVYLGGVSLTGIIPAYLHHFEARLRTGATVRVCWSSRARPQPNSRNAAWPSPQTPRDAASRSLPRSTICTGWPRAHTGVWRCA